MDILDDILMALRSYAAHDHKDQGLAYLEIFGVLQGLSVQQDAVMKLHRIVTGISLDLEATSADVKEVRETRVRVAGHPVGGKASSHFMVRYTVSKAGFELWTYDQGGGRTIGHVNVYDLIVRNSKALGTALDGLIRFMEEEDKKHKAAFASRKLFDMFSTATYLSGKLFESLSDRNPIGKVGTGSLRAIVSKFTNELANRSPHFRDGLGLHRVPTLEYALLRFEQYIDGDQVQNEDDAYILARYVQVEIENLSRLAKEIDDDYAVSGSDSDGGGEPQD